MSTPANINYLSVNRFKLDITKIPTTSYFAQSVSIPALSMTEEQQFTAFNPIPHPGGLLDYDLFDVTFVVDEDLKSWMEVYNWIKSIAPHKDFGDYDKNYASDATLTIMNNKYIPKYQITFENLFPMNISELAFSTQGTDEEITTATAAFRYTKYEIKNVI